MCLNKDTLETTICRYSIVVVFLLAKETARVRIPLFAPNPQLGSRKNLRNAKREQRSRSPYKSRIVFERSGGVKRPRKKSGKLNPQTTLKSLAKAMHYKQVAHLFLQQIFGSKTIVANRALYAGLAQLERASPLQGEGRRFDPVILHQREYVTIQTKHIGYPMVV